MTRTHTHTHTYTQTHTHTYTPSIIYKYQDSSPLDFTIITINTAVRIILKNNFNNEQKITKHSIIFSAMEIYGIHREEVF